MAECTGLNTCSGALARLVIDIERLAQTQTGYASSRQLSQALTIVNNEMEALRKEMAALPGVNVTEAIQQALAAQAVNYVTTLVFGRFSVAINNELAKLSKQITDLPGYNIDEAIRRALADQAILYLTVSKFGQFSIAINNELASLSQQICNVNVSVAAIAAELDLIVASGVIDYQGIHSIDGVAAPGGDIDLVGSSGTTASITITPDPISRRITFAATTHIHVFSEVPSGPRNDFNTTFTLANIPATGSLALYLNGVRLQMGLDYELTGPTITFAYGLIPGTYSTLLADYLRS